MKIIAVIPARFGSTRFPGKPLVHLKNKPILKWVIEGAKTSELIREIIVATDHKDIFALAKDCGVNAVMTSETCQTGTDRIYEAVRTSQIDFDVVLNIQGDEPLINKNYINPLAQAFLDSPTLDMATLSHPLNTEELENKNAVKVLINQNQEAIYFSRYAVPFSRLSASENMTKPAFQQCVQKHIGLYGYSKKFLREFCQTAPSALELAESLEQLRALHLGAKIKVISVSEPTIGIDTPEDLERLENKI